LVCFFLPLAILFGDAAIFLNFAEPYLGGSNLGPAWVLAISTLLSWLILLKLTGLGRLFALASIDSIN